MEENLKGKVQTVLGVVDGEELGITLAHEHLLIDMTVGFSEPQEESIKALVHQPVTLENLGWVRYNTFHNLDNLRMQDVQLATDEVAIFKQAGGNTIVDATNIGLGRDPESLVRIAQAAGLNILMGAGYYVEGSWTTDYAAKTEDEIAEEIVCDITVGVGHTNIRAGFIGEVGNSWPWTENEKKNLRAAISAQKHTGAALMICPGFDPLAPFQIVELLREEKACLSHTIMCHMELSLGNFEERCQLAKAGCYLEFDSFGKEGYFDKGLTSENFSLLPPYASALNHPNDLQRIDQIIELINAGYVNQILLAHDACKKTHLSHYGGAGYGHILRRVVPLMQFKGVSEEHIRTMLIENPKRAFTFI